MYLHYGTRRDSKLMLSTQLYRGTNTYLTTCVSSAKARYGSETELDIHAGTQLLHAHWQLVGPMCKQCGVWLFLKTCSQVRPYAGQSSLTLHVLTALDTYTDDIRFGHFKLDEYQETSHGLFCASPTLTKMGRVVTPRIQLLRVSQGRPHIFFLQILMHKSVLCHVAPFHDILEYAQSCYCCHAP